MKHELGFAAAYDYDSRQTGINIPVIIRFGSEASEFYAKVDTGSNLCIFERHQGEKLGLDIESGIQERISTVTGSFLTYGHEIGLSVLGIETTATVYFASDENFTRNVLGRQGWLDRVRLGVIDYDGRLYLSAYDDPSL
jgi:hypothetical protein